MINQPSSPSPDLTSKFDNIWGTTTPPKNGPDLSWSQEIMQTANEAQDSQNQQPEPSALSQTQPGGVKNSILGHLFSDSSTAKVGQDIGRAISGGDKQMNTVVKTYTDNAQTLTDLAGRQTDPSLKGKYMAMAASDLADAQKAGLDLKGKTPEQVIGDVLGAGVEAAGALSLGLGAVGLAGAGAVAEGAAAQGAKTFGQKVIQGGIQGAKIGGGFGVAQGTAEGLQSNGNVGDVVKSGAIGGLVGAAGGGLIGGAGAVAPELMQGAKGLPGKIVDKARNLAGISTRTEEQILATPEKDLGKLTTGERNIWFKDKIDTNTQNAITQNEELTASHRSQNLQHEKDAAATATKTAKTAQSLQEELNNSSTARAIALKPKVQASLKENSEAYKKLFENDIAGKESAPISNSDLSKKVDKMFPDTDRVDNSYKRDALKAKLGITDDESSQRTAADVYNQLKGIKANVSAAAKKGSRVFSSSEMQTNDAMSVLSSTLKDSGIDLSKSNAFWKQYAPIRDKMVNIVKPFDAENIDTKKASTLIKDVAKGTSADNKILVSKIEKHIGEPLADDQKAIVAKMDKNEQQALADKVQKEVDKSNLKQKQLEERHSNAVEQGVKKDIILAKQKLLDEKANLRRKIIGWVVGGAGATEGIRIISTHHL